jgi:hypothetical protein
MTPVRAHTEAGLCVLPTQSDGFDAFDASSIAGLSEKSHSDIARDIGLQTTVETVETVISAKDRHSNPPTWT